MSIKSEDYEEPCCCCTGGKTIPTDRVLSKLDEYFAANDYAGAEHHLKYWMEEAKSIGDMRGLFLLESESIGFYRKSENREKAFFYSDAAIKLAEELGFADTVDMATTYINAATAYSAFGEFSDALPLYDKARELYERLLPSTDPRLGGLYNNMAISVMSLGDTKKARDLFGKALAVMEKVDGGEASCAITYCNLADLAAEEKGEVDGEAEIAEYLEKAMELLDKRADSRDGAYAYACEKCAPSFGHYGYFVYEKTLADRARSIYEGH